LEGKLVILKKPFAVLRKLASNPEGAEADSKATSFDVVGVIRQKYLFKTRPRPLISSKLSASASLFPRRAFV
jgi:chromosome transmission fidelity protein 8